MDVDNHVSFSPSGFTPTILLQLAPGHACIEPTSMTSSSEERNLQFDNSNSELSMSGTPYRAHLHDVLGTCTQRIICQRRILGRPATTEAARPAASEASEEAEG